MDRPAGVKSSGSLLHPEGHTDLHLKDPATHLHNPWWILYVAVTYQVGSMGVSCMEGRVNYIGHDVLSSHHCLCHISSVCNSRSEASQTRLGPLAMAYLIFDDGIEPISVTLASPSVLKRAGPSPTDFISSSMTSLSLISTATPATSSNKHMVPLGIVGLCIAGVTVVITGLVYAVLCVRRQRLRRRLSQRYSSSTLAMSMAQNKPHYSWRSSFSERKTCPAAETAVYPPAATHKRLNSAPSDVRPEPSEFAQFDFGFRGSHDNLVAPGLDHQDYGQVQGPFFPCADRRAQDPCMNAPPRPRPPVPPPRSRARERRATAAATRQMEIAINRDDGGSLQQRWVEEGVMIINGRRVLMTAI